MIFWFVPGWHNDEWRKRFGFDPARVQRVLILDDTYFEGSTFYLAQQLFESSFAGAEVRFLAGHTFDWRRELRNED